MSDSKVSRTVTIVNQQGLHARPAYLFAEMASKFESQVELIKDGERIDGKSILSILTLAAGKGTIVSVEATGPDAQEATNALVELIVEGFPAEEPAADASETGNK